MDVGSAWSASGGMRSLYFEDLTDDRVEFNSSGLSGSTGAVSAWVQKTVADSASKDYVIWSKVTSSSDRIFLELETQAPGISALQVTLVSGSANRAHSAQVAIGDLLHIVGQWSPGAALQLFVNGVLTTGATHTARSSTTIETIGGYSSAIPTISFGGHVFDLRRYNRLLDSSEVRRMYARGPGYGLRLKRNYYATTAAAAARRYSVFRPSVFKAAS
jgi:hypothetical protein